MIKKLFQKIMKKYQRILFVGSTDILPEPLSKEEEIKYYIFYGLIGAILFILAVQFIVSIIYHFCFNPIERTRELKKEKELEDRKSVV